jgi:deazaflavin-dependent oxidoreductase (nitroreductase family)
MDRMVEDLKQRLRRVAGKFSVLLTHIGRKSGKEHRVRIWFAVDGDQIIVGTANIDRHWVRNVQQTPKVRLTIGQEIFDGDARFLSDSTELERGMQIIHRKYWPFYPIIKLGDLLIRARILRMQNGVFEVTLRGGPCPVRKRGPGET